jgi:uncharacterized protein (DUF1800 family)
MASVTGARSLRSQLAHLYRRAGFGATPAELDAAEARGYQATVDLLLDLSAADPGADAVPLPSLTGDSALSGPASAGSTAGTAARRAANHQLGQENLALISWWLQRMVAAHNPLREKLAFFWHGHFATSIQKVRVPARMYRQNQLFRTQGAGNFEVLTQAVAKDPAMLIWLDSNTNRASHPNENFARELMELFTLGIGNYTETDVKEAARCFTGWTYNGLADGFVFRPGQHDEGQKQFLGVSGDLGGEDVIRIVTHAPASAAFISSRLFSHLAYPVALNDPVVRDLSQRYATNLDIAGLLRAIFVHPAFQSEQARQGLVKQPVEYVVGVLRAFGGNGAEPTLPAALTRLGQVPFAPPNVGGWPQNSYWLTTATELSRLSFAAAIAAVADLQGISDPEALAHRLSIDAWNPHTDQVLRSATTAEQMVTLALTAPEYVLN